MLFALPDWMSRRPSVCPASRKPSIRRDRCELSAHLLGSLGCLNSVSPESLNFLFQSLRIDQREIEKGMIQSPRLILMLSVGRPQIVLCDISSANGVRNGFELECFISLI